MKILTEGDAFGGYRVVRCLGKCGLGKVWLLRLLTGEDVVAKLLARRRRAMSQQPVFELLRQGYLLHETTW